MNRTEQALIVVVMALVITVVITAAVIFTNLSHDNKTSSDQANIIDDIGYDYSQYDVLKNIVSKLDANGGKIIDVRGNESAYSASRDIMLKDDMLIITSVGGNEMYIYHIHDIRAIIVN